MCACDKQKKKPPVEAPKPTNITQDFSLTLNGRTQRFGSRLEAAAMNVRLGGAGIVKPV